MKTLTKEEIESIEQSCGEPCRFVEYPGIGTVVVKQADENAWFAFERGSRQVALGKAELRGVMKNLVSACLVYPSAVEFDAAVKASKKWRAWQDVADIIVQWAGGDIQENSLGNA